MGQHEDEANTGHSQLERHRRVLILSLHGPDGCHSPAHAAFVRGLIRTDRWLIRRKPVTLPRNLMPSAEKRQTMLFGELAFSTLYLSA